MVVVGFTVTTTLNDVPEQLPVVGVTEYVAVTADAPVFVKVPEILVWAVPVAPPVNPVPVGVAQLYVVPVGTVPLVPSTGVKLKASPLHIVTDIAVTAGTGFTDKVNSVLALSQFGAAVCL